jgi:hypothetical protein
MNKDRSLIVTTEITWNFSSEIKDTTHPIWKGRMSILVRLFVHHLLLKFQNRLRFQRPFKRLDILNIFNWCPGAESNHRHEDFQSTALPTELPGPKRGIQREGRVLNPRTLHRSSNARPCVRPVSAGSDLLRECHQCRALPIDDPRPATRRWPAVTPV